MAERTASILAEIPIGRLDVLRVTRESERGQAVVKLRRWFASASGELRPGREGIVVGLDEVPAVLAALVKARGRSTDAGAL